MPVKEDLSDIFDALEWAKENPEQCKKIVENAYEYATKRFSRETLKELMIDYIDRYHEIQQFKAVKPVLPADESIREWPFIYAVKNYLNTKDMSAEEISELKYSKLKE